MTPLELTIRPPLCQMPSRFAAPVPSGNSSPRLTRPPDGSSSACHQGVSDEQPWDRGRAARWGPTEGGPASGGRAARNCTAGSTGRATRGRTAGSAGRAARRAATSTTRSAAADYAAARDGRLPSPSLMQL